MKWGVRRYQNKDGTLTTEGKAHYSLAFQRESGRARRYDARRKSRLTKAANATRKAQEKHDRANGKYGKDAIPEKVQNKLARYDTKSQKAVNRAKAAETQYKHQIAKMRKKFANVRVTDIDPVIYDNGKAYATMLMGYGTKEPYITFDNINGWHMEWDN